MGPFSIVAPTFGGYGCSGVVNIGRSDVEDAQSDCMELENVGFEVMDLEDVDIAD